MHRYLTLLLLLITLSATALAAVLHHARRAETTNFRLAYVQSTNGSQSVFTMDFNGENRRQLTDDYGDDFAPAWSPTNSYIAFYSFRGLSATVYMVPPQGGGMIELALSFGSGIEPQWSPDGRYLVFERFTTRGSRDIMLYDTATGSLSRLDAPTQRSFAPAWAQNAQRRTSLLYISAAEQNQHVFLADATRDDDPGQQITSGAGVFRSSSWLPAGDAFVASAVVDGNEDLYVRSLAGQPLRRLTTDPAADTAPVVSPDGRLVAFISERTTRGSKQLYVLALDDAAATPQRLTDPDRVRDVTGRISWSPGGEWLAFTAVDAANDIGSVYRVHHSGRELRRLTDPELEAGAPSFSPGVDLPNRFGLWWLGAVLALGGGVVALRWR